MIPAIIEVKSGPVKKWVGYQTAAQRILLKEALGPVSLKLPVSEWKIKTREGSFAKDHHWYFDIDGHLVPGITETLKAQGLIVGTEYASEDAMWRGQEVHRIVHHYNKTNREPDDFDPMLIGYLRAWKKFKETTGFVYLIGEQPLVSESYRFGGTMDNFGYFFSDRTSLYITRYGLQLKADGTYNLTAFHDHSDEQVFLCALTVYNQCREDGVAKLTTGGVYAK